MEEMVVKLRDLLRETARAHHAKFPGIHEDWAMWYADYMFEKIPPIMGRQLCLSELIYALMLLSKEQPEKAPDARWTRYYAEWFAAQYGGDAA